FQKLPEYISEVGGVDKSSPMFDFAPYANDRGLAVCFDISSPSKVVQESARDFFCKNRSCKGSKICKVRCCSSLEPRILKHGVTGGSLKWSTGRCTAFGTDFFYN